MQIRAPLPFKPLANAQSAFWKLGSLAKTTLGILITMTVKNYVPISVTKL